MRLFHLVVTCLIFCVLQPLLRAESADALKTEMKRIAVEPFTGTAAEYKAFSRQQGDALVAAADKMLALSDLSAEDKRFAIFMKYWGLVRRYGFDRDEYDTRLTEFANEIETTEGMLDLYKAIMGNIVDSHPVRFEDIVDPKERTEAFTKHADRAIAFIAKYCKESDPWQLTFRIARVAEIADNDGSLGLVESTVEKLMPTLKEQEKSRGLNWRPKSTQGRLKRVRLTGKEMEYKGVSTEGALVDVNDYRGKVVFLDFETLRNDRQVSLFKKLYEILHEAGLVMIVHDCGDSRKVAKQKAAEAGIPWIITCRDACHEKNLADYYEDFGLTSALFLIGRDGKVVHSWSNGFCPSACETLKTLFPEQADKIAALIPELEENERLQKAEDAKWFQKSGNPLVNELDTMLHISKLASDFDAMGIAPDPFFAKIVLDASKELAELLLTFPDASFSQRTNAWTWRLVALGNIAQKYSMEHPETRPEEIYVEFERAVNEFEKTSEAEEHASFIVNCRSRPFYAMQRYLEKVAADKPAYAREIWRWRLSLIDYVIDTYKRLPKDQRSSYILNMHTAWEPQTTLRFLERDEKHGLQPLVVPFCEELIPVLEQSGFPELAENANLYRAIVRRNALLGKELEFECILLDGTKFDVKEHRGKFVLVNFWNTQCGPCLREFPNMKKLYEKYKDKGYEMIAYSCGDSREALEAFLKKNPYPWLNGSIGLSTEKGLRNYDSYYGITGNPTTFLVDRDGKVVFMMIGSDDEKLNAEFEKRFGD